MHPVMLLPAGADTQALRKALWHYRIGHRITDEADGQLLWVADPRQHEELRTLVSRWERGEPLILEATRPKRAPAAHSLAATLRQVPVTALMIGVSLLVFALSGIFGDLLIVALTIVPVGISGGQLVYGSLADTVMGGQVWRLLSPAFLHFGWMHLIFNLMWVWYFGRQIELRQGSKMMLLLLLVAGIWRQRRPIRDRNGAVWRYVRRGLCAIGPCVADVPPCPEQWLFRAANAGGVYARLDGVHHDRYCQYRRLWQRGQ